MKNKQEQFAQFSVSMNCRERCAHRAVNQLLKNTKLVQISNGGNMIKNKVSKSRENKRFDYEEEVKDFSGLIFHCPDCDAEMHLHIARVKVMTK